MAAAATAPHRDPQTLAEILEVVRQADSPDSHVQKNVTLAVQKLHEAPQTAAYLATIFMEMPLERVEVRQQAGLLLKNNIWRQHMVERESGAVSRRHAAAAAANGGAPPPVGTATEPLSLGMIPSDVMSYVKRIALSALTDGNSPIRSTAGTIITTIMTAEGADRWPEALTCLVHLLDSDRMDVVESAFSGLMKIVEDELSAGGMIPHVTSFGSEGDYSVHDSNGADHLRASHRPLFAFASNELLPKVFQLLSVAKANDQRCMQKNCMLCLNIFGAHFAFAPGEPLERYFGEYWQALGALALDPAPEIRLPVIAGMINVVEFNEMAIFCNADPVVSFFVDCCSNSDKRIRFDAMEFWMVALKSPESHSTIQRYLSRLLPCLVESTRYSEGDYLQMDVSQLEDDNAEQPDEVKDIQPRFHQHSSGAAQDDGDDDDDDSTMRLWGSGWTLRKAAALTLDLLSNHFPSSEVLPHVLPIVEARLMDDDWELRESAVLTLGAISQGCMEALSPFLPRVLTVLLGLFEHPKPLLRSISAWCVCRFGRWVCLPENRDACLKPLLAKVLSLTLDRNKRVQEAAASSFAAIEEEARTLLVPYLDDITNTLVAAFGLYQANNLLLLYDAVGTLADSVGSHLNRVDLRDKLMSPIFHKWQTTSETDVGIVALFECITCLACALQEGFAPYAKLVVERCIRILQQFFTQIKQREYHEENFAVSGVLPPPLQQDIVTRELVDTSLDLLSAVTDSLDIRIIECFEPPTSPYNFLPLVERCCTEPRLHIQSSTSVSAFALVGILAKNCTKYLMPHLPRILPQLNRHVSHGSSSVSNNAVWAIGVLALKGGPQVVEPFVDPIMQQLCRIVQVQARLKSLLQTACYTIVRLGLACPNKAVVYLDQFLRPLCLILTAAPRDEEKLIALRGICVMIEKCHRPAVDNIQPLLEFVASFYPNPNESSSPSIGGGTQLGSAANGRLTPCGAESTRVDEDASAPPPPPPTADSASADTSGIPSVTGIPSAIPPEELSLVKQLFSFLEVSYHEEWLAGWSSLRLESQQALRVNLRPDTPSG